MKDKLSKKDIKKAAKQAKKAHKKIKKFGYKKFFVILLVTIILVAGCFFGYSYYKYQDPFYFFKPQQEENNNNNENVQTKDTFLHTFKAKELNNKTSIDVNGLSFTYPSDNYSDSVKGVKIGSSSHPQTSPWVLESTFPSEATIDNFEINVANNKSGSVQLKVEFDTNQYNLSSSSYEGETLIKNNLNIKSSNFKLSLTNSKGSYLKSLKIKFNNPSFEVSEDVKQTITVVPGENGILNTAYAVISLEEYYKDVDLLATGENLRNSLRETISNYKTYTYDDARYMLPYTDERVDKKGTLYGVYNAYELDAEWNNTWAREHIWPCSNMRIPGIGDGEDYRPVGSTKDYRSDLHNLRAITNEINSTRGDKFYGNETKGDYFFVNNSSNENDDFRGDCARIIFYMALHYPELKIVNNPTGKSVEMGDLDILLEWNKLDQPDDFERQRNNRIYEYQGNRNPFIDYPDLVDKLYA